MLRRAIPLVAALGLSIVPLAAAAQTYIAAEINSVSFFDDGFPDVLPDIPDQYGLRGRIGYQWGEDTRFSVEGGAAWATFQNTGAVGGSSQIYQGFGGLRLALGEVLSPGVYGHVGYGEVKLEPDQGANRYRDGVTIRAGVSLDLFAGSDLSLGVHLDWNRIFLGETDLDLVDTDWAGLGAQIAIIF